MEDGEDEENKKKSRRIDDDDKREGNANGSEIDVLDLRIAAF